MSFTKEQEAAASAWLDSVIDVAMTEAERQFPAIKYRMTFGEIAETMKRNIPALDVVPLDLITIRLARRAFRAKVGT